MTLADYEEMMREKARAAQLANASENAEWEIHRLRQEREMLRAELERLRLDHADMRSALERILAPECGRGFPLGAATAMWMIAHGALALVNARSLVVTQVASQEASHAVP